MTPLEHFKEQYIAKLETTDNLTKLDIIEQNMNAIDAGVEFAQRWIPVEEESPAEHDYVLAKSSVGDVYVANYSRNKYHVNMPFEVKITHWRPIDIK